MASLLTKLLECNQSKEKDNTLKVDLPCAGLHQTPTFVSNRHQSLLYQTWKLKRRPFMNSLWGLYLHSNSHLINFRLEIECQVHRTTTSMSPFSAWRLAATVLPKCLVLIRNNFLKGQEIQLKSQWQYQFRGPFLVTVPANLASPVNAVFRLQIEETSTTVSDKSPPTQDRRMKQILL